MTTGAPDLDWRPVCRFDDLEVERGAAALVAGKQVAVFRTHDGEVHALANRDPFSGACVIARGIVGTRQGVTFVASPMHKQRFDLRTGECLDNSKIRIQVFRIRVRAGMVEVKVNDR
jgi:nitrite reductase (NADH) small subunit